MFTGIVARSCRMCRWSPLGEGRRLVLDPVPFAVCSGKPLPWKDLEIGESIAVNGCCLTLVRDDDQGLGFDVIEETLRRTSLADLSEGSLVNLERSLRVGDRLGGHYVTGHIDAIGEIRELREGDGETILTVEVVDDHGFRVIPKGSVTVDGISLTVAGCGGGSFHVALIPHTLEVTNLRERGIGERVNLETDHLGKWVEALLAERGLTGNGGTS